MNSGQAGYAQAGSSQAGSSQVSRQQMASSIIGLNHSIMAMQAAKRMRSSKQKRKTGHVVCHHLRMMLAADEPVEFRSAVPGPLLIKGIKDGGKKQFTLGL